MIEAEACQNANELTARIMARAGDGLISDVTVRTVRLVLLPEMEGSYLILYQQYMSFCIDLQCFNFKLQGFKSSSFLASPRIILYKQTALCLQITSSG